MTGVHRMTIDEAGSYFLGGGDTRATRPPQSARQDGRSLTVPGGEILYSRRLCCHVAMGEPEIARSVSRYSVTSGYPNS